MWGGQHEYSYLRNRRNVNILPSQNRDRKRVSISKLRPERIGSDFRCHVSHPLAIHGNSHNSGPSTSPSPTGRFSRNDSIELIARISQQSSRQERLVRNSGGTRHESNDPFLGSPMGLEVGRTCNGTPRQRQSTLGTAPDQN